MINRMIGLLELYTDGFPPSSMPPCGGALAVLAAVAPVVITVVVTKSVTVVVADAMSRVGG